MNRANGDFEFLFLEATEPREQVVEGGRKQPAHSGTAGRRLIVWRGGNIGGDGEVSERASSSHRNDCIQNLHIGNNEPLALEGQHRTCARRPGAQVSAYPRLMLDIRPQCGNLTRKSVSSNERTPMNRHVPYLVGISVMCFAAASACAAEAASTNAPPKVLPWETTATFGATLTKGNSDTLALSANVRSDKKWYDNELHLEADGVYGENEGVVSANAVHGAAQYNRLFTERLYGYFRLEALHDDIAKVDYRVALSPGAGYYFVKRKNLTFRGEAGPGYVLERLDGVSDDYVTLRLAERAEWKITERAKIWESVEFLPQVDRFQNYVVNAEIGLDTAITKKFSQTILLQDSYRSEPAAGRDKNDLKLIAGISYKF